MAALNSLMQTVCGVDRAGRVVVANSAAGSFFQRNPESLWGTEIASLLPEEALPAFEDVMNGRVQRPQRHRSGARDESGGNDEILQLYRHPHARAGGLR